MKPLRVLHVVSVDRQNYYLSNLAEYTDPAEVEYSFVTLAAPDCDFVRDFKSKGWNVRGINLLGKKNFASAYFALIRLMKELRPDVVHTHLFDASLVGLTAAKSLRIKTVLTRHHSDAVHVLTPALKRKFYLSLENYISRKSDHIIAPAEMVRDFLVEREGVPAEKVSLIPYGQTTERYDAVTPQRVAEVRNELGMDQATSFVFVSRLFHRKGHRFLFEALAELAQQDVRANLYLVGDGDYQAELEAECRRLRIEERVRFLGWRDDALVVMAAADVVVHPSLEDALSSAVIEAIMLRKPIVATDISGVRDSLGNGKYGEIVKPADPTDLKNAMIDVLKDIEAALERAAKGRDYLLEYMDAGRVAEEYTKLYFDVVGETNE